MKLPWTVSVTGVFTEHGMQLIRTGRPLRVIEAIAEKEDPEPLIAAIEELLSRGDCHIPKAALLAQEIQREHPTCKLTDYLPEEVVETLLSIRVH